MESKQSDTDWTDFAPGEKGTICAASDQSTDWTQLPTSKKPKDVAETSPQ
jgi:hypothetical protein